VVLSFNKTAVINDGSTAAFTAVSGSTHTGTKEEDGARHIKGEKVTSGQAYWKIEVPVSTVPAKHRSSRDLK